MVIVRAGVDRAFQGASVLERDGDPLGGLKGHGISWRQRPGNRDDDGGDGEREDLTVHVVVAIPRGITKLFVDSKDLQQLCPK